MTVHRTFSVCQVLEAQEVTLKKNGKKASLLAVIRFAVPTKTQLSNFLGTPGEDYFKGNPKSLNFYFLVIWWGKFVLFQKKCVDLCVCVCFLSLCVCIYFWFSVLRIWKQTLPHPKNHTKMVGNPRVEVDLW